MGVWWASAYLGLFEKERDGTGLAPPPSLGPFSYSAPLPLGLFVFPQHGLGCPRAPASSALMDSPWVWGPGGAGLSNSDLRIGSGAGGSVGLKLHMCTHVYT